MTSTVLVANSKRNVSIWGLRSHRTHVHQRKSWHPGEAGQPGEKGQEKPLISLPAALSNQRSLPAHSGGTALSRQGTAVSPCTLPELWAPLPAVYLAAGDLSQYSESLSICKQIRCLCIYI